MELRISLKIGATLVAVAMLSACASAPSSPDQVVVDRAQARWDAVVAKDWPTAYTYYSPGYRALYSATDFEISMRLKRVRWTSAKYEEHSCDENLCKVRFRIGYRVGSPVPGVDTWNGYDMAEDQWVKTKGEWWFVPEKK